MTKTSQFISIAILLIISILRSQSVEAQDPYGGDESSQGIKKFEWPENKRVAISLTFDDARPSQVDIGIPVMDKYGVRSTFYISPGQMMERLEKWKQAVSNGHEIGNHTNTHPCTGNFTWSQHKALELKTLRDIALDIEQANQVINETFECTPSLSPTPVARNM